MSLLKSKSEIEAMKRINRIANEGHKLLDKLYVLNTKKRKRKHGGVDDEVKNFRRYQLVK